MAFTPDDFTQPEGRLEETFFEDLDNRLSGWIADATGRTQDAEAQEQWVYHRAFQAKADALWDTASSFSADGAYSESRSAVKQAQRWEAEADKAEGRFGRLTEDDPDGGGGIPEAEETVYIL